MKKEMKIGSVRDLFTLFSDTAMQPKAYKKKPIPKTVTVSLSPELMDTLSVVAARIGANRAKAAEHILTVAIYEAAAGCGFTFTEKGKIPEKERKWDLTQREMGITHYYQEGEE